MPTHSRILEEVTNQDDNYSANGTNQRGSHQTAKPKAGFEIVVLDTHLMEMIYWVANSFGFMAVSSFGIVCNIINIRVFLSIGFTNTINISLFGLSVSDFCSLVTLFWVGFSYSPLVKSSVFPFIPRQVAHLTGCWPHVMFCRASGWITAFVAFERFLCIAFPLKVKQMITTREVKIIVGTIFFFTFLSGIPLYYAHRLGQVYLPELNNSLLGVTYSRDREFMEPFAIPIISVVPAGATFFLTSIFTVGLVFKLNQKARWRNKASNQDKDAALTSRDDKLARMMLAVCTIFIVCFTPFVVLCIVLIIFPEFGTWYGDVYMVAGTFAFLFEGINSSVNIFVYYNMSSRYKEVFDRLLGKTEKAG